MWICSGLGLLLASGRILSAVAQLEDTYHGCDYPKFEWAVAPISKSVTMAVSQMKAVESYVLFAGMASDLGTPGSDGSLQFEAKSKSGTVRTSDEYDIPSVDGIVGGDTARCMVGIVTVGDDVDEDGESLEGMIDVKVENGSGRCEFKSLASSIPDDNGWFAVAGGYLSGGGSIEATTMDCSPLETDHLNVTCDGNITALSTMKGVGVVEYFEVVESKSIWLTHAFVEDGDVGTFDKSAVTGTALDVNGDVYVSGYVEYATESGSNDRVGALSKLSGTDGSIMWTQLFPTASFVMQLEYDPVDDLLFATSFVEKDSGENKPNAFGFVCYDEDGCYVVARLSTDDGSVEWARYVVGYVRPRLSQQVFGSLKLAHPSDGDYIYSVVNWGGYYGEVPLDVGTDYAGCEYANGTRVLEHEPPFNSAKKFTPDSCSELPEAAEYVANAGLASATDTGAKCPSDGFHCLVKYHKRSGLPVWGAHISQSPNELAPVSDGLAMAGFVNTDNKMDSLVLPSGVGILSGYDSVYQGHVSATDGKGTYVQSIVADRAWVAYASLVSAESDTLFLSAVTTADVTYLGNDWALELSTETCDKDVCMGIERTFLAKLNTQMTTTPSCIESCAPDTGDHVIKAGTCYINQVCYNEGDTGARIGNHCLQCITSKSQTEWSSGEILNDDNGVCYIDNACVRHGVYARRRRWESTCQWCDSSKDRFAYSVKKGYRVIDGADIGDECAEATVTFRPTTSPTKAPTRGGSNTTDTDTSAAQNCNVAWAFAGLIFMVLANLP